MYSLMLLVTIIRLLPLKESPMIKLFTPLHNESGFYLPIVLVTTTLVFSFLTMFILQYQNNTIITHSMIDQIKSNSVAEMIRHDLINEFNQQGQDMEKEGELTYHYPNAKADIEYNETAEYEWTIISEIYLEKSDTPLRMTFLISLND